MTLKFGKHKGKQFKNTPLSYKIGTFNKIRFKDKRQLSFNIGMYYERGGMLISK